MERLSQAEFLQRLSDLGKQALWGVWKRVYTLCSKPLGKLFGLLKKPVAAVFGLVKKPLAEVLEALKKPTVRGLQRLKSLAVRGSKKLKGLADKFFETVESAARFWNRRGWSPTLFSVGGCVLLFIPVNVIVYLLECLLHAVTPKSSFLLAWLVFSGTMEAWMIWLRWSRDGNLHSFFADIMGTKHEQEHEHGKGVDDGDNGGAA